MTEVSRRPPSSSGKRKPNRHSSVSRKRARLAVVENGGSDIEMEDTGMDSSAFQLDSLSAEVAAMKSEIRHLKREMQSLKK